MVPPPVYKTYSYAEAHTDQDADANSYADSHADRDAL